AEAQEGEHLGDRAEEGSRRGRRPAGREPCDEAVVLVQLEEREEEEDVQQEEPELAARGVGADGDVGPEERGGELGGGRGRAGGPPRPDGDRGGEETPDRRA